MYTKTHVFLDRSGLIIGERGKFHSSRGLSPSLAKMVGFTEGVGSGCPFGTPIALQNSAFQVLAGPGAHQTGDAMLQHQDPTLWLAFPTPRTGLGGSEPPPKKAGGLKPRCPTRGPLLQAPSVLFDLWAKQKLAENLFLVREGAPSRTSTSSHIDTFCMHTGMKQPHLLRTSSEGEFPCTKPIHCRASQGLPGPRLSDSAKGNRTFLG